ncbi:methyl-accepting chemotaxis protein [Paenibacillus mendelii]|uniref:Methyl-accepting chemotaxis protein n=1 Tax=Paenibacillus mendelii TaxID=206163 RepID=A0ABV6JHH6_9BACL|nr:methyl-accepting chemotaxis protein [Paenibacillus mendelii]MCQ6558231.1 methyl-accepting chemotaxis protein [Paenibacillus mendelii]
MRAKLLILISFPVALYVFSSVYWINRYETDVKLLSKTLFETTNKVSTLVLNGDRDMYQSLTAFQFVESGLLDEEAAKQMKADMIMNAEQAVSRVEETYGYIEKEGLSELTKLAGSDSIRAIVAGFRRAFPIWVDQAQQEMNNGQSSKSEALLAQFEEAREELNVIGEIMDEYANSQTSRIIQETDVMKKTSIIGIIFCLIAVCLIAAIIVRGISRMVRYVVSLATAAAKGDLREQPAVRHSRDELGQIAYSIEAMIAGLRQLVSSISHNSNQVSAASAQMQDTSQQSVEAAAYVAADIQEVNNGMEVQARAAEETSRSMEEMAAGIGRIAVNTTSIFEYSSSTSVNAEQGQNQLNQLDKQMEEIKAVISQLSVIIAKLNERSNEIGMIAENITTFSNQTNILSLNASIEAARAGEHGRGFTVVASEIRKLAAQSLQSAIVINQLVSETQGEVMNASLVMETTLNEVNQGSRLMVDASESFASIRGSIQHITTQIHDNSAIAQQLSASSEEISATMEQSAHMAQTNMASTQSVAAATEEQLALMEDIASASEQLRSIVLELDKSVATFKVN